MAENQSQDVVKNVEAPSEPHTNAPQSVIVKKSGTALSLLAILIALGVGSAGYYFGQQQVNEIQQKLTALESQTPAVQPDNSKLDKANEQLAQLEITAKTLQDKLNQVDQLFASKDQAIANLQVQLNQVRAQANAQQPNDWLFSEADFLLNNALRKLVLDNDVDTSVSLLKLADETLTKVATPQSSQVRQAISQDLKQLLSVTSIDQNAVMQQLSELANTVDELPMLNVNFNEPDNSTKLSDSLADWQTNVEKSAVSFLNHFIRISPKQSASKKELLAPNQDIYLRENIRLRLQLAIMAVPRQQNDLYKESLEAVASWVRSYFDTDSDVTKQFLKSVDELADVSIYVDVPNQLQSLTALDKLLNRTPIDVQKIEIETDKAVADMPKAETPKTEDVGAKPEPTKPAQEPQQ